VDKSEGMEKTMRVTAKPAPGRIVVFLVDGGGEVLGAEAATIP
jgi:altronate dehydratase